MKQVLIALNTPPASVSVCNLRSVRALGTLFSVITFHLSENNSVTPSGGEAQRCTSYKEGALTDYYVHVQACLFNKVVQRDAVMCKMQ